jgi:hypothetical protein
VSILITCAIQRSLCDFINLTIFFFLIRFSSSFVFILHAPSLSYVGPYSGVSHPTSYSIDNRVLSRGGGGR